MEEVTYLVVYEHSRYTEIETQIVYQGESLKEAIQKMSDSYYGDICRLYKLVGEVEL